MSGDMPELPDMPDDGDPGGLRKWAEKVQAQNKILREAGAGAAAELQALKRDRAFDQAGVPSDKWGKLVRKEYDGDLDPESIKAAAKALADEYGFQIEQQAASEQPAPQPQDQQQVDPLAAEREALAANRDIRSQFATPSASQSSALQEAISKAETREEMHKLLAEANLLTTAD